MLKDKAIPPHTPIQGHIGVVSAGLKYYRLQARLVLSLYTVSCLLYTVGWRGVPKVMLQ